jgi:hypothetical protein
MVLGQQWSPSGSNKFIEQQYLTNVHGPGASPTAEKVIAWQINSSQVPVRSSAVTGYIETGGVLQFGTTPYKYNC